jgi:hypothetical protein
MKILQDPWVLAFPEKITNVSQNSVNNLGAQCKNKKGPEVSCEIKID